MSFFFFNKRNYFHVFHTFCFKKIVLIHPLLLLPFWFRNVHFSAPNFLCRRLYSQFLREAYPWLPGSWLPVLCLTISSHFLSPPGASNWLSARWSLGEWIQFWGFYSNPSNQFWGLFCIITILLYPVLFILDNNQLPNSATVPNILLLLWSWLEVKYSHAFFTSHFFRVLDGLNNISSIMDKTGNLQAI